MIDMKRVDALSEEDRKIFTMGVNYLIDTLENEEGAFIFVVDSEGCGKADIIMGGNQELIIPMYGSLKRVMSLIHEAPAPGDMH